MRLPPWHLHPDVWLLFGSIVAAYLIAARRHLAVTGEETPRRKKVLFLTGMILMAYNMFKTIASGKAVDDAKVLAPAGAH